MSVVGVGLNNHPNGQGVRDVAGSPGAARHVDGVAGNDSFIGRVMGRQSLAGQVPADGRVAPPRSVADRAMAATLRFGQCAAWAALMGTHVVGIGVFPVALAVLSGLRGIFEVNANTRRFAPQSAPNAAGLGLFAGAYGSAMLALGLSPVPALAAFCAIHGGGLAVRSAISSWQMPAVPATAANDVKTLGERVATSLGYAAGCATFAALMGSGVLAIGAAPLFVAAGFAGLALRALLDVNATRLGRNALSMAVWVSVFIGTTATVLLATGAVAPTVLPVLLATLSLMGASQAVIHLHLAAQRQARNEPVWRARAEPVQNDALAAFRRLGFEDVANGARAF